jgi:hypothetical protein
VAKNLKILHTQVGPFLEGRVVRPEDFGTDIAGNDIDIDRLLRLEAVVETDEPLTEGDAPLNPHNMPKVDSAGRVVDLRGQDRPTAAGTIPASLRRQRQTETREKAGLPEDVTASSQDEEGATLEGEEIDPNEAADQADEEARQAAAAQPPPTTVARVTAPVRRTPVAPQPVRRQPPPARRPVARTTVQQKTPPES